MNEKYSILSLAFIGDAHYNLTAKRYIIDHKVKGNDLQKLTAKLCSAKFQAEVMHKLLEEEFFTEEEVNIFKRGRNAKNHSAPKNTEMITYKYSTGFEALWGYHYINNNVERLAEIWDKIETIEE